VAQVYFDQSAVMLTRWCKGQHFTGPMPRPKSASSSSSSRPKCKDTRNYICPQGLQVATLCL